MAGQRASRFQLKCVFYNVEPPFERIALLLQRQLAAVGIDLVLEGLDGNGMRNRLRGGQFDAYLYQLNSGRDLTWAYRFMAPRRAERSEQSSRTLGTTAPMRCFDRLRQAREDENIRSGVVDLPSAFL